MAPMGDVLMVVSFCGSFMRLIIPLLAQWFFQTVTPDVGAGVPEHLRVGATSATDSLLSTKHHQGRIFSLILEIDCLNVPLRLLGNGLGFISAR